MRLILATRNEHKRREFERLLPDHEIVLLPDTVQLPPEDGATFAENAFGKARAAAAATGQIAIADDSGVEAAALGGAPGVRSARYAGEHASDEQNLAKLLREAPAGSALAYVCALAYVDPVRGVEQLFEQRCNGRLAAEPRGGGGFGYDPAFLPDDIPGRGGHHSTGDVPMPTVVEPAIVELTMAELTMAELTDAQKDAISHRGRAARALQEWLLKKG